MTTAFVSVSDFNIRLSRMGMIFVSGGLSSFCSHDKHNAFRPSDFRLSHSFAPPQNRHANKGLFSSLFTATCCTASRIFSIVFSLSCVSFNINNFEKINKYSIITRTHGVREEYCGQRISCGCVFQ